MAQLRYLIVTTSGREYIGLMDFEAFTLNDQGADGVFVSCEDGTKVHFPAIESIRALDD